MPAATMIDAAILRPLDRLRGQVRRFVLIDGLLTAALFVVAWFWLGLAFDFGLFKVSGFDWVLDAPRAFRAVALAALGVMLLGLLVSRLAVKLTRSYSYPAPALVLEKRYPALLQDKLITAVELADPARGREVGFSAAMIEQTIAKARIKVAEVPLDDVFNSRRLRTKAVLAGVFAVGTLAAVYFLAAAWSGSRSVRSFAGDFGDVAAVWGERNLLLWDTPWPRRAHLEVIEPDAEEHRIGKDAPPPRVRVRAVKWVIADRAAAYGWRPLRWVDVTPQLLGFGPPDLPSQQMLSDADLVEAAAPAETAKVFEKLAALAASPRMSRKLRMLAVPAIVTVSYSGEKTSGTLNLSPEPGGEFAGEITGLKETVRYRVRGEDFATRSRQITLVPPPQLVKLTRQEFRPAYLHHPPPVGQPFAALKGLRQETAPANVSLTGDKSVVPLAAGTEVVLRGTADKPLARVLVRPKIGPLPGKPVGDTTPLELKPTGANRDEFALAFRGNDRPAVATEFDVVLEDDDAVTATRTVVLQIVEDAPPRVELAVDVLRKAGNAYLVTPAVRVPFVRESKVSDDHGLSRVEYLLTYSQVESPFFLGVQAQYLAGVFAPTPAIPGLHAVLGPAASAALARKLVRADDKQTKTASVGRFAEALQSLGADTPELLAKMLAAPVGEGARVVKEVAFNNPATDYFDLAEAAPALAGVDASGLQPRYRAELSVTAADTNVETGPKTGQNLDPIRLSIVSEADLLVEFSKDEEGLTGKIDDALRKLRLAQNLLAQTAERLAAANPPADLFLTTESRAREITLEVEKAKDDTGKALTGYRQLLREAEVNRCSETLLRRYAGEIIDPLQAIIDGPFARAEQAHAPVLAALAERRQPGDGAMADDRAALAELVRQLTALREKLGEVLSLAKLRDAAVQIVARQKQLGEVLKRLAKSEVEKLGKPVIVAVAPIDISRGAKVTVRHPLDWGTFSGDVYTVQIFAPPGSGLKVPVAFRVPDEKNEVEYDVIAGDVPGEYVVKVVPSVGSPVDLIVRVK